MKTVLLGVLAAALLLGGCLGLFGDGGAPAPDANATTAPTPAPQTCPWWSVGGVGCSSTTPQATPPAVCPSHYYERAGTLQRQAQTEQYAPNNAACQDGTLINDSVQFVPCVKLCYFEVCDAGTSAIKYQGETFIGASSYDDCLTTAQQATRPIT